MVRGRAGNEARGVVGMVAIVVPGAIAISRADGMGVMRSIWD